MSLATFHLFSRPINVLLGISQPFRVKLKVGQSFATVADPPVRRYGGLKDQDRIFTNVFCRHDHGLKGAQVRVHLP